MAIAWLQTLLIGTRDGVNKSFLLPDIPDPNATRIVYNGRVLYKASTNPASTEYTLAGNAVQLGLAPNAIDDLWIMYAVETSYLTSNVARIHADFYYTIELRNTAGDLLEILQTDVMGCWWKYTTVGGCGEAEIVLAREFDNYGDIHLDHDIQIWRDLNPLGEFGTPLPAVLPILLGTTQQGARQLWYSGFVREIEPSLAESESVKLRCSGYVRQLGYLAVLDQNTGDPLVYNNTDVGQIARDIIDTYVIPGSKIKRTAALGMVPNIGIFATTVQFKSNASEALQGLAEIGGNLEWGVRADKEFYFVPRTAVVRQQYFVGDNINLFETTANADDVVNRVYLAGADGLFAVLSNGAYQTGSQKERIIVAAFIASQADATLWGTAYFAKFGASQPRGRLALGAADDWIEGVGHPLGLLRVLGGPQFIERGDPLGTGGGSSGIFNPSAFDPAIFDTTSGGSGGGFDPSSYGSGFDTTPESGGGGGLLPLKLGEVMGALSDQRFRINAVTYQPAEGNLTIVIELGEKGSAMADYMKTIEMRLSELRQLL